MKSHPSEKRQREFDKFHAENPQVYAGLRQLAVRWKRKNHRVCGIQMLYEVLRWQTGMKTTGEEFKLNNNYCSLYARLLMEDRELAGMFQTRQLRRTAGTPRDDGAQGDLWGAVAL